MESGLAARSLTYGPAGVTAPGNQVWTAPAGRRAYERSVLVGRGEDCWSRARAALLAWGVKTRSGFVVEPASGPGPGVRDGADYWLVAGVGPLRIREPARVVAVVDRPGRCGFAYGTLQGHPVSGEEAFVLHRDDDGVVRLTLRSVTAPGSGLWRLVFPVVLVAQRWYRRRYARALVDHPAVPATPVGRAADLPPGVARVLVAGSSGAGKTTMARALAERLGVPHTEIDALWHGPGWVPRPEFERDVEAMLASGRWVAEYQYRPVKDRLLEQAQAVVWLDHPFPLVVTRLLRRSLIRAVTRRAYWNGNRESVAMWLRASHPLRIVLSREFWAKRRRTEAEFAAAADRGVPVIRLRGARRARRWLAAQG